MNRSTRLRLGGQLILLFPLILLWTIPASVKIILMTLWPVLLVIYYYPSILSYIAFIMYNTKGKTFYLKLMASAYKSKRIDPESAATYSYILLKDGQLEKSSEVLDYAENRAKEMIRWRKGKNRYNHVHSYRALILWKEDRIDDAADLLINLLKENYRTSVLYANLGWFLIKLQKYDDALAVNLEALEYDRSNAILDNIGLTYMKMGDLKKSHEFYTELIGKDPDFPDAWFNFGQLLEQKGIGEEAQKMYRKSLDCEFSYLGTVTKEEVELAIK